MMPARRWVTIIAVAIVSGFVGSLLRPSREVLAETSQVIRATRSLSKNSELLAVD